MCTRAPPPAGRRRLSAVALHLQSPLVAQTPAAGSPVLITALAFVGGAALAYSYEKYGYPRFPGSAVPVPDSEKAKEEERKKKQKDAAAEIVGSGPLTGPAKLLDVHESGWVAPDSPSQTILAVPDFARSAVTFVIDLVAKPAATMSDTPVNSTALSCLEYCCTELS